MEDLFIQRLPVSFTLIATPSTKKNSGIITRGIILPSKAYQEWHKIVLPQIKAQWSLVVKGERIPCLKCKGIGRLGKGKHPRKCYRCDATGKQLIPLPTSELNCCALIYRAKAIGDAVNFYEAIGDALEDAGVVINDKWITQWDGSRMFIDRLRPRIEVTLTPLDG